MVKPNVKFYLSKVVKESEEFSLMHFQLKTIFGKFEFKYKLL